MPAQTTRHFLFLLLLISGGAAAGELCKGLRSAIEPDMQIRESDLTTTEARKAVEQLRASVGASDPDQTQSFGTLNQLQRLTGYMLRQQAFDDIANQGMASSQARQSTRDFCEWLATDGFWYD